MLSVVCCDDSSWSCWNSLGSLSLPVPAVPTLAAERLIAAGDSCQLTAYWDAVWWTQMQTTDLLSQQQSAANPFLLLWTDLNHKYPPGPCARPAHPHLHANGHTLKESGGWEVLRWRTEIQVNTNICLSSLTRAREVCYVCDYHTGHSLKISIPVFSSSHVVWCFYMKCVV